MARTGWSASNFLRNGSPPLTAAPLTLACWYWPAATGTTKYIFGLYNSSGGDSRNMFAIQQNSAGTLSAKTADGTTSNSATTAGSVTTSAWQHVCAVFASATSRAIYLAGGNKATNATSRTPTGINRMSVGIQDNSAASKLPIDSTARIAHCAIWNAALSDADVASLGAGVHPLLVRPDALVFYSPVNGQYSPEIGYVGGLDLTINGSLSAADDPRVFWPSVARRGAFHSAPVVSVTLTGVSGLGQVGAFSIQIDKTPAGVAGSGSVGIIKVGEGIPLPGVEGDSAIGAMGTTIGQSVLLIGAQADGHIGSLKIEILKEMAGVEGVGHVGQLSAAAQAVLVGVAGVGALGNLSIYNSTVLDQLLQSGEFKMADLYTIVLADGITTLRYTTADIDIVSGGQTFSSVKGKVQRGKLKRQVGVQVDEFEIKFFPDLESDLLFGRPFAAQARLGLFDGCSFRVERAFMPEWGDLSAGTVLIFVGEDATVTAGRTVVTFQANSLLHRLNVQVPPNVFQAACLHTLYDKGCGLVKGDFTVNTSVRPGATTTFIPINAVNAAGYFDQGTVLFNSGPNTGIMRTIKKWDGNGLFLSIPLPDPPGAGNLVAVAPGCDRAQSTCLQKFNNLVNFRATPYVPVPETAV